MKKLIAIVILMMLVMSLFVTTSAEEQEVTISEKEAYDLVQKSFDFYYDVRISEDYVDKNTIYKFPAFYQYEFWGEIHTVESEDYYLIIEEKLPGGSYSAMCKYAESIYSADIAPESYKYSHRIDAVETNFWYLFYKDESGIMYSHQHRIPGFWNGTYDILANNGFEVGDIEGDINLAKATVSVWINCGGDVMPAQKRTIECIFQNTDEGWRIAKSEYSNMMATDGYDWLGELQLPDEPESPTTADPNFDYLILITIALLGSLALIMNFFRCKRIERLSN